MTLFGRRCYSCLSSSAALTFLACGLASAQTASIQGTVVDSNGKPVSGAAVSIGVAIPHPLPSPVMLTAASKWVSHVAATSSGVFTVTGLAAGTYVICAESQSEAVLNNCNWPGAGVPPDVTLTAGQAKTGVAVKSLRGSTLEVRFNDTLGLLAALVKVVPASGVRSGVFGSAGIYYPTHISSVDPLGQTHTLNIPFDVDLKYSVTPLNAVKLTDTAGAAIPTTGTTVTFRHTTGAAIQPSFAYTITKP